MRVDSSKPFRIVYSFDLENQLGPLLEVYAVQLGQNNNLSLTYQRLYTHTSKAFTEVLDDRDREIIRLTTEYSAEKLARKYGKPDQRPHEFMAKIDEEVFRKLVRPFVEKQLQAAIPLLSDREVYLKGKSGNPAHEALEIEEDEVSVHFHFKREEEGTVYYPTFRLGEEKLVLTNRDVLIIAQQPCYLLFEGRLLRFEPELDGNKIKPFFGRYNIEIPRATEPDYYKRFVSRLIEKHHVVASGFKIHNVEQQPLPELHLAEALNGSAVMSLMFDYHREKVPANDTRDVIVRMEHKDEQYTYYKLIRRHKEEKARRDLLKSLGVVPLEGAFYAPAELMDADNPYPSFSDLIAWLTQNRAALEGQGFHIVTGNDDKKYFIGEVSLNLEVKERIDWFDIYAVAVFGEHKVPFSRLRKLILNQQREFTLPDGSIAVIPNEWIEQYSELLQFSDSENGEVLQLKKHHYGLLESFSPSSNGQWREKLHSVLIPEQEETDALLPEHLVPLLRDYQKEGFRWMCYLRKNKFGGCLADDMGLGKTLQTLAVLSMPPENKPPSQQERKPVQPALFDLPNPPTKQPSLIVMPTSLVHNWAAELKKWAPALKQLIYTGTDREVLQPYFRTVDVILTTYGTVRNDIAALAGVHFHYAILDESQAIKNPASKVSQAVRQLKADHRLTLTGTPVENSLSDLWAQMTFLNPGLLGSYNFFRDTFISPIEKKNDASKLDRLKKLVAPFILRRTKQQVARELPPLTEEVYFSEMSTAQKDIYERVKNQYREKLLGKYDQGDIRKNGMMVLRGLMQLRQIANHPLLADGGYEGNSGKFDDMTNTLLNIVSEGHKVIIFSQFLKQLKLLEEYLGSQGIAYSKLTGETKDRQAVVERFRNQDEVMVFLISLKAGNTGLTLIEADYVFLCDPWWNPAIEAQAINRTHRIGQTQNVFAYRFISKGTVEEKILHLQNRKRELTSSIIQDDRLPLDLLSREVVAELFS